MAIYQEAFRNVRTFPEKPTKQNDRFACIEIAIFNGGKQTPGNIINIILFNCCLYSLFPTGVIHVISCVFNVVVPA